MNALRVLDKKPHQFVFVYARLTPLTARWIVEADASRSRLFDLYSGACAVLDLPPHGPCLSTIIFDLNVVHILYIPFATVDAAIAAYAMGLRL